jgi:hypothetical protein
MLTPLLAHPAALTLKGLIFYYLWIISRFTGNGSEAIFNLAFEMLGIIIIILLGLDFVTAKRRSTKKAP